METPGATAGTGGRVEERIARHCGILGTLRVRVRWSGWRTERAPRWRGWM